MPFATGAQTSIAFIAETTWGVTPATPELTLFPVTSASFRPTKDVFESRDIRGDRQTADLRHGYQGALLDVDFELRHGQFDWLLEGALFGAWSSNVVKGGTTRKSFLIEQKFGDITQFKRSNGLMVNSLSLNVGTDGIVTGRASLIGKQLTIAGTTIDNAGGYTAPAAKSPMAAKDLTILEGGASIASVTAVEIQIENGLAPAKVVGAAVAPDMFSGRSAVTGKLSAFFENATLLNKFLNETASSLSLAFTDGTNTLTWLLPRIKYTGGEAPVNDEGGLVLNMPFTALYDGTTELTSIKITRS